MKRQFQGISLIIFGILLEMYAMIDPWVPVFDNVLTIVAIWTGVICGTVGLVFSFKREE